MRSFRILALVFWVWTALLASSITQPAGGTPASPVGSVQFNLAGAFGGNAQFIENVSTLPVPTAPTLATVGTAGATTYGYTIVGRNLIGGSVPSAERTIATGNATLDGINFINVTVPACPDGRVTSYDVYRTTAGGTPSTTGLIAANVACSSTTSDQALAVIQPFTFLPSLDYSVGTGSNQPYVNTSGGSAFGCGAFANNSAYFPFEDAADGLAVLTKTSCMVQDAAFMSHVQVDDSNSALANESELEVGPGVVNSRSLQASLGQIYSFGQTSGSLSGLYGTVGILNGGVSDGDLLSYYNSIGTFGTGTLNGDGIGYYMNSNFAGPVNGRVMAYFNVNFSNFGQGRGFAWYSRGGTERIETGAAEIVGLEIAQNSTSQTGDLLRLLKPDSAIGSLTFTGAGLNDASTAGEFDGVSTLTYCAIIDGTGPVDTFKWGTNGACDNGALTVPITGKKQAFSGGLQIVFAARTGHTLADKWSVVATAPTVLANFNSDGRLGNRVVLFADLGTPGNAQQVYCSNCTVTSGIDNTCIAGGAGAWAARINGAWKCEQ